MKYLIFFYFFCQIFCSQTLEYGIDRIDIYLPKLKNKRVGIVVNHSSKDKNGKHLFDILTEYHIQIVAIFAPEHGFLGNRSAGAIIEDDLASKIFSLHGKRKKPTPKQMSSLDILIYDIQDVGTRFYTYISTLGYVMQAVAENNKELIILDRPVLMGGNRVEGPLLDTLYRSFIGLYPIPVSYGLSSAELALMIKDNSWLANLKNLHLEIVKVNNWKRKASAFNNPRFIPPSPNIPTIESIYLYSGLCLLEGTNISEGRGTDEAFSKIGAPWFKTNAFIKEMKKITMNSVKMTSIQFLPKTIKGKAYKPKYENQICQGVKFHLESLKNFNGFNFALYTLHISAKLHPKKFKINRMTHFTYLLGKKIDQNDLVKRSKIDSIIQKYSLEASKFKTRRKKYLLY